MVNELKDIPTFDNEDEERTFWASHDSTEYIEWSEAEETILPLLKPSTNLVIGKGFGACASAADGGVGRTS